MSQQLGNRYYEKGDTVQVQTLGLAANDAAANSWILNSATTYKVSKLEKINSVNYRYKLTFNNPHIFRVGDKLTIIGNNFNGVGKVYSVNGQKQVTIGDQGSLDNVLLSSIIVRRNILKGNATNFDVSQFSTNVQNVYKKDKNTLVASSSLPSTGSELRVKERKVTFSGTFPPTGSDSTDTFKIIASGDHGFFTGDAVYYTPQQVKTTSTDIDGNLVTITTTQTGIAEEGIYFVKRISDTTSIKLAKSRSQLFNDVYVTTEPISVTANTIQLLSQKDKSLDNQKLFREIPEQNNDLDYVETEPGTRNGILLNGVEVLNYKSRDQIIYGKIESIIVDNPGTGYDVINPPNLVITDSTGVGATGNVAVSGNFKRIDLLDGGFDYLTEPKIVISGGNGSGASAKANTKLVDHEVNFNSEEYFGLVTLGSTSAIGFSTYHKFRNYERVTYKPNGQSVITGLSTGASYYVSVQNPTNVKLHKTYDDAVSGINTVTFSDYGTGRHTLVAATAKMVVSSIDVISQGTGYENKKTTVVGLSTSLNEITINSHGYSSGEKVKYTTDDTEIGGLTSGTEYYITSIDSNTVRLSQVGPTGDPEYYYRTGQFVNLTSPNRFGDFIADDGIHHFNYPDITVSVSGKIGVSTISAGSQSFQATFLPIVRGSITSVNLQDRGVGYGSSEILNFVRDPDITLQTGSSAQLTPVVANGKIIQVIVNNGGSNINAVPELTVVSEIGQNCVLSPVISGGQISSVNVINGGSGYLPGKVEIQITYPGNDAKFRTKLQEWTINQYQKNVSSIVSDDGFVNDGLNQKYGLQYVYLYAPRFLRQKLYQKNQAGETLYNSPDLILENGAEKTTSKNHSPIIGWAYDGNPIYGPFGYVKKSGGVVVQMKSGYTLRLLPNRPPTSTFPEGFFVEDYLYVNSPDDFILDENNGRFCITPDFPNGTYAYFATFSENPDSQGIFKNYKSPAFPYLIGKSLYSKPSNLSYLKSSNQDDYDVQDHGWVRNTKFYNLDLTDSSYAYVERPYKLKGNQRSEITFASPGGVERVGILTGGTNYKVDDKLVIDNTGTSGFNADIRVSKVGGKTVSSISCATTSINSVQVSHAGNSGDYYFYADSPHGYLNGERISISGVSTTQVNLSGQYQIGISTATLVLRAGVGTTGATGIVTYFSVYGTGLDKVTVNDIFKIEDEKIKILNIDNISSRIRVLREVAGTAGASHTATTVLYEDPRRFSAKIGVKTSFDFKLNRELYFNPTDTLAIGTQSGVGIGTTIVFSNPGSGITQVFVPTQTIYIPAHGLFTGDELVYNLNGESESIGVSTSGISTFALADQTRVYVAKINDNEIGISTVKVGLNSTGSYAGIGLTNASQGLLYFTGYGQGSNHSFSTNYPKVITVTSAKNTVTVATAATHGLGPSDNVYVDVNPSITTSFAVTYNDYNRRIVIDKKDILAAGINTSSNEISISNHGYVNGQSVIYTASSPAGGLNDESIYYVVVVDKDTIRLSQSFNQATAVVPETIDITSATDFSLSPINPQVKVYKNSTVEFDLSDSTLTYTRNSIQYPAFEFKLFVDENFNTEFTKSKESENFEVSTTGTVGVDGKVTITLNDKLPKVLYYSLIPISNNLLPVEKLSVVVDTDVVGYNQLQILNSKYSGKHSIYVASPTTFYYHIAELPEKLSYTPQTDAVVKYSTDSLTGIGSIVELKTFNAGSNYYTLPSVSGVISGIGSNAAFEVTSNSIGSIKKTKLNNIGFDYPYDKTLRPTAKLPEVVKIDNLGVLESVGVTSFGYGYGSIAPKIILLDGQTKEVKDEVDLEFAFGSNQVNIIQNTYGINKVQPTILPTKNSNGVGISSISYDSGTKDVTVRLSTGFTTAGSFPFAIGDEIMIENVSVGIASTNPSGDVVVVNTGKGYNTENYEYNLFIVSDVDENIGGLGIVTFSLDGYIPSGELPGTFNSTRSAGRIIPKKHFPTFDVTLTTTNFINKEDIVCLDDPEMTGVVERWDTNNGILKLQTLDNFTKGHTVEGQTSKARGVISSILSFNSNYDIDATSRVESGWQDITGFLNDTRQVVQDSDYYQKFSYSLKSKIALESWDDVVGSLNHTAGFKRFSNLVIETTPTENAIVGLGTTQSHFDRTIDFIEHINLNCVYNFDRVKENFKENFSDNIIFSNRILTDYEESIGNRVLNVDNVADTFNSNPRPTRYSDVARWSIADGKAHKFVTYVQDTDFTAEAQIMMVSVLHDALGNGYVNQYARLDTQQELGTFDYTLDGTDGVLRYYPVKYEDNGYNVFTLSYNVGDIVTSVGSTNYGGSVKIDTTSNSVAVGTTTNIVSIASTYGSAKVLVEVKTVDGAYEYDELTLLHDGTNVELLEYGQLSTVNVDAWSGGYGIGTYYPYIDGSNIKIDFVPNVSVASSVNTIVVAISSEGVGVGSFGLNHAEIGALPTSIAASGSPTENAIAEYSNGTYNGAYCIVQVSDPDNNHHQVSELLLIDNGPDFTETFLTEFGTITSSEAPAAGLGTFGATVSGDAVRLTFTPNAGINAEVRTFYNYMKYSDDGSDVVSIDFTNAYIDTQYGDYTGTNADVRRSFRLQYGGYDVFERYIDSTDEDIIGSNTSLDVQNAITIPNHFFVSGEKLTYSTPGVGTTENIGIGLTNVSGIGNTDKLPETVYAIKVDSNRIRLTDTAEKALKSVPNEYFDITSVGIGTSHTFTANDQNAKCLIAIDNYIQSPIVATALTTSLTKQLFASQDAFFVSGVSSISGGDLLKIGDELMKVKSVGVGSTNVIRVNRAWVGTVRAGYSTGDTVTKVTGNYNIVNNTLNFVEAPYGNNPLSTTSNPPDSRDWVGITTSSTFQGRVFLRSGTPGSTVDAYGKNYIFDNISSNFTGTENTFTLAENSVNTTGIEDDNAIILINDIFQIPGLTQNFTLAEQAGITSAVFVDDGQSISYDVNSSNLPIGGVIISVGSSAGFGYQPRVSAGGTATISVGGTVSTVTIGNTGSGYRGSTNYQVLTSIATTVGIGSTIMTLVDENSVFKYLDFLSAGSTCTIGVGTYIKSTNIISVGTTSVNIGIGSTSPYEIFAGTSVAINIQDPQLGIVRVGVARSSVGIVTVTHVGVATISDGHLLPTVHITNGGSGYTSANPPNVIIEEPLSYDNVPLVYQTDGLAVPSTGIGSQSKVSFNVGFGSDVIDFEISNTGFGYGVGQYLTVPTGGVAGIPTDPTLGGDFERFSIIVKNTYTDKFAGWSVGQLQTLDNFDNEFDGSKTDFQIKIGGNITSIIASKGSSIVIQDVLLVFYNNILQVPGEGYIFNGGSTIIFPEAPKPGDTVSIVFYRGNGSVDVQSVDILETVKEGDTLQVTYDPSLGQSKNLEEDKRIVYSVDSTDLVTTNAYYGPGNVDDTNLERPVIWCMQETDRIINGKRVAKDRPQYKANIFPSTNVIQTVGVGSTVIYIENTQPLFNQQHESSASLSFQKDILLVSQDARVGASATAVVSAGGTISSIVISDGGSGYSAAPTVIIGNPVGLGTTQRQVATTTITSGSVSSISVDTSSVATGYASTNPPVVLIEPPKVLAERINSGVQYQGDFGTIVGVATTSIVGVASTGLILSLFIPQDSALKDTSLVGTAITVSSLSVGDFFVVRNSNIGFGVTSLKYGNAVTVGVGTTCIDNVYEVVGTATTQKTLPGVGSTTVNDVTVSILSYNGYDFSSLGINTYFGNYSFGKITTTARTSTSTFNFYNEDGLSGISTSALVRRFVPLKIQDYNV